MIETTAHNKKKTKQITIITFRMQIVELISSTNVER